VFLHEEVAVRNQNDFIRHEMMAHVPMLAHGRVERVLILGGVGGGLAKEVRRHHGVEYVLQVQPEVGGGPGFLATTNERFDLILMEGAFTERDFRDARGSLRAGGLVIARLGAPFLQPLEFSADIRNLSAVFSRVAAYLVPVPGEFGGPVAMGWGSNVSSPDDTVHAVLTARFAAAHIETRYYTPEVHRASFALPRFVDALVNAATCPRDEIAIDVLEQALAIAPERATTGASRC
jgi:spermidine synthase